MTTVCSWAKEFPGTTGKSVDICGLNSQTETSELSSSINREESEAWQGLPVPLLRTNRLLCVLAFQWQLGGFACFLSSE